MIPSLAVPGGLPIAGLLLALLGLAVAQGLRALGQHRDRRRRTALAALRVATAVCAWLVAIQPTWRAERLERAPGRVQVLVDASRSMTILTGEGPRSDVARTVLAQWERTAAGREARTSTFGASLRAAELGALADAFTPRDDDTRLGAALREAVASAPDTGAIVVVSDGAERTPGFDASALRSLGVRVHTIAVAPRETPRDDAIAELHADPVAFLRQPGRVRVVVRSLGGGGGTIPVTLRLGGEVVREALAEVPPDGEAEIELTFPNAQLGRAAYTVSIPHADGDVLPQNDTRAFLVRVVRDELRVLLVCGRPSWDERFLRAFLKKDPAIDLISFFILRTQSDLTMSSPDELALIPFPTDELFSEHLGSFDVVLFQNFEYGPYQMAQHLPGLRDYVQRGGSFAMVGGDLSFASGGYAETPLADVLPVALPASTTRAQDLVVIDRFRPELVPDALHHPLVALWPDTTQTTRNWSRLSPVEGANIVLGPVDGARVLMTHPSHRTARGAKLPVLVAGTAGRGRTLALMTDTAWRWGFTTGGETGDVSAYERFWDRALRWLARDPSLEPARLSTDRERYGPSATVEVDATLRDAQYVPLADRAVRFAVRDVDGNTLGDVAGRTDASGRVQARLNGPELPGAYRAVVTSGTPDALAEEWFVVESGGDELADPRARPDLLRELAEATGGEFHDASDAPDLSRLDATRTRSLGIVETAPFASWWFVLIVAVSFVVEWFARRAWGVR